MIRKYHPGAGRKLTLCLPLLLTLLILSCDSKSGSNEEPGKSAELLESGGAAISISPDVPADIPGGAANADLTAASIFAWQEFIALNWPAVTQTGALNTRDTPDKSKFFGAPDYDGPLVWETYRHKAEIFPGEGNNPPGYISNPDVDYGYDHLPEYNYLYPVLPCPGETVTTTAWVNLDEVSQIALDNMYAGALKDVAPTVRNTDPQRIRFLAKANRTQYGYIAQNNYWNFGGNYYDAVTAFTNAVASETKAVPPDSTIVNFPEGTIEIKAAWRLLAPGEDRSRFHTAPVRFYANSKPGTKTPMPEPCYCQDTARVWGLIALHIVHKTPTAPYFTFATFEQADNLLTTDGKPVEDENGTVINQPSGTGPTTPGTIFNDPLAPNAKTPPALGVSTDGPFVPAAQIGSRLYYRNVANGLPKETGGSISVNKRAFAIPSNIIAVNKEAHLAIASYNAKKNINSSPWQYYKLVNVQWRPFNKADIDTAHPNGVDNPATYFQANIVVETNNTLQEFSGQQIGPAPAPFTAFSMKYSGVKSGFDFLNKPFHNVYLPEGNTYKTFTMGGCMGCHGNAQAAGADFSFILFFGPVQFPEFPENDDNSKMLSYMRSRYGTGISAH